MKYILGILLCFLMLKSKAHTFEGFESEKEYTCYHIDSNNVHCYKEDSEADLDLDNDGIHDREYIFSTPETGEEGKQKKLNEKGVIRNRKQDTNEDDVIVPDDTI